MIDTSNPAETVPPLWLNTGAPTWVHRRANARIPLGEWHHVTAVCDARPNGQIRFYVDGRPSAALPLSAGVPLDLDAFRIGAWKHWQSTPQNNYHGTIDEVRIYRGTLTDAQVADLAADAPPK